MTDNEKQEEQTFSEETKQFLTDRGYKIGEKIGFGSYGSVYKGLRNKDSNSEEEIAIKVMNLENASRETKEKFLPREMFALKELRHPNIIRVYDIFTLGTQVFFCMSLAKGDLIDVLEKSGPIPEERCKVLFKEIMDGLQFVHYRGITHRDLKVDNILLDSDGHAIITDFGFARRVYSKADGRRVLAETYCGTTAYTAPEVLQHKPYNPQIADIWSMGVVLYVMVNDDFPFDDNDEKKMVKQHQKKNYTVYDNWSPELTDLLAKLLEPDVEKRITISEILSHPWLVGIENTTPILLNNSEESDL